jgi:hypothetical protein
MPRLPLLPLLAALCFAQAPPPPSGPTPPAEVDRAVRARIQEFNDLQVAGQYRKAEAYVAEDTKDFYYGLAKPRYKSLKILSIEYSGNFTRAKALIACEIFINAPPYPPDVPLKSRFFSYWKLENGAWYYYDDASTHESLFGRMTRNSPPAAAGSPGPGSAPPGLAAPGEAPELPAFVLKQVKPDKESVALKPGQSAEVTFTNHAPGQMTLTIDSKPAGVDVKIQRSEIPAGGTSVVVISAGKGAKAGTVGLRVVQTAEVVPIQVRLK